MTVGSPDFNLNSYGIQYKEKKVNYTTKRAGINISSNTQTTNEDMAEKKVMNSVNPTGTAPTETKPLTHIVNGKQVDKPKQSKFGKQPPKNTTPAQATSTAPTQPHEEGVFDNVPETKDDMITQEGGSKAGKLSMNPKSPSQIKYGRSAEYAKVKLSEDKANPVTPVPKGEKMDKKIVRTSVKANDIILKMNIMKLDLMEIKKRKDMGDVGQDPSTEGLDHKEVSTDAITGKKTVRPKHVQGGGFPGKERRTMVDGVQTKVPQSKENTKPKEGQVKHSLRGDMHTSQGLNTASTGEIKESFDMITNSPKYQESIHRDAPLTEKEGTDKFDAADPKTQAIRDRIAARAARKKKSIDEINDMTDSMKELMKESTDEEKKDFAIKERNYEALSSGGGKPDNSLLLDIDKPTVKKIKNDTAETIFKAISLKLDLIKMDYNTESQYPHVEGTSGYKDPKKKLPTAPKDDPRRMSPSFDESHNHSEDEEKT